MKALKGLFRAVKHATRAWAERRALRGLDPRDAPEAERVILAIKEETAEPYERREKIHELFEGFRQRIRETGEKLREDVEARYERSLRELEEKILAPDLPVDVMSLDDAHRVEKAKAMYNSEMLKQAIQDVPVISSGQRVASTFLLVLSFVGSYLTVQRFFGSDFLGSEGLSMAATAGIGAVLTAGEIIALYGLAISMGRYKITFLKILGMLSALILLAGVIVAILARGELGSVAVPVIPGLVE